MSIIITILYAAVQTAIIFVFKCTNIVIFAGTILIGKMSRENNKLVRYVTEYKIVSITSIYYILIYLIEQNILSII